MTAAMAPDGTFPVRDPYMGAAAPKPPPGRYYAACGRQAILGLPPQTPFRFLKKAKSKTFKLKAEQYQPTPALWNF
jgi:hypothetical protein